MPPSKLKRAVRIHVTGKAPGNAADAWTALCSGRSPGVPRPKRYAYTKSPEKYTCSPAWRSVAQITWSTPAWTSVRAVRLPLRVKSVLAKARPVNQPRCANYQPTTASPARNRSTFSQPAKPSARSPTSQIPTSGAPKSVPRPVSPRAVRATTRSTSSAGALDRSTSWASAPFVSDPPDTDDTDEISGVFPARARYSITPRANAEARCPPPDNATATWRSAIRSSLRSHRSSLAEVHVVGRLVAEPPNLLPAAGAHQQAHRAQRADVGGLPRALHLAARGVEDVELGVGLVVVLGLRGDRVDRLAQRRLRHVVGEVVLAAGMDARDDADRRMDRLDELEVQPVLRPVVRDLEDLRVEWSRPAGLPQGVGHGRAGRSELREVREHLTPRVGLRVPAEDQRLGAAEPHQRPVRASLEYACRREVDLQHDRGVVDVHPVRVELVAEDDPGSEHREPHLVEVARGAARRLEVPDVEVLELSHHLDVGAGGVVVARLPELADVLVAETPQERRHAGDVVVVGMRGHDEGQKRLHLAQEACVREVLDQLEELLRPDAVDDHAVALALLVLRQQEQLRVAVAHVQREVDEVGRPARGQEPARLAEELGVDVGGRH